ncbi:hypothetical protein [Actinacidiphila soli]|uniref:hypothetical protein n=1 Tax=Actinacidiphila soli TaxID=2487275 RepID=UPI000FCC09F1|nr:hypothetical protein [Actinacidiphila soli]
MDKKVNKNALRAGAIAAGTALMLLVTSPAFAQDEGLDPGKGLSVAQTLGLFVGCPLALFAIISGLVIVTDKSRKHQKG